MAAQVSTSTGSTVGTPAWQSRIGRQGIYDRQGALVAHELLIGGVWDVPGDPGGAALHSVPDSSAPDSATSVLISTTLGDFGRDRLGGGLPLHLNVTRAFLVGDLRLPFDADGIVLEVLPDVAADDDVLAGIRTLRSRGYRFSLEDFAGEPDRSELLALVDVVSVNPMLLPSSSLSEIVQECRRRAPRAILLAKNIEHEGVLSDCLEAGFDLFEGYYFQRPVLMEKAQLSPTQAVCLRLLEVLGDPDVAIEDIHDIVAADPGLSLVVLRGANSVSAAQQRTITSLTQAIVLLGPPTLKSWVTVTLLGGGLTPGNRVHLMTILARAECCAALTRATGGADQASAAYLAGLLSGIAQVVRADVGALAVDAGVDDSLVSALTIGSGLIGKVVEAVVAHEVGLPLTGRLEVVEADLARVYLASWGKAVTLVGRVHGG